MHSQYISTSPSASTRPRAVCTCFLSLCGTLQGLVVSLERFGWPFGSIVAPWASILTHMGYSWEAFGHFGETLGLHLGTLGLHLGTLGVHVGVLWALWGVALDPSGHFCRKGSKKVRKIIGLGSQAGSILMIFSVFVESGKQRLDCACAVGLGLGPLVFTLWASMWASTKNDCCSVGRGKSSAAEAAPSYLSIRTQPL